MSFPRYPNYKPSGVEWLGEVPGHWMVSTFRHCLSHMFNGLTATQIDEAENTVPVTRIETISYGVIDESKLGFINSDEARADRALLAGDILFSNINSLNMVGKCAFYPGGRTIYAGMNLLVLRPAAAKCSPLWLCWLVRSASFRCVVESLAKPAINQASVSQSSINSITIAAPPLPEQTQIAAFLDRETAKIDELVAEQRRLMELLKEKRQAVISHAVTQGLNPHVPMKTSGIEWLGDVPEHWEISPLKYVATHNDEVLDEITAPDTEIVYVDISSVDGVNGIKTKETMLFSDAPSRARRRVRHGDVIVSTVRTYLKAIARIRDPEENLIASTGFAVIRPRGELTPDFLGHLLFASYFIEQVIARSTGVSYPAINASALVAIPVTVPPPDEQTKIAAFLDRETAKYDTLTAEAQHAIDLLQERRTALISAAVTGQIDVRGVCS